MKQETKRKIIFFVRKLLRYDVTKDPNSIMIIRTDQVKFLRSQQMFRKQELTMLSEDQIKYHANMNLMSELEKQGLIKYETRDCDPNTFEHCIFEAQLKVITP